jgi:hypothetical protein
LLDFFTTSLITKYFQQKNIVGAIVNSEQFNTYIQEELRANPPSNREGDVFEISNQQSDPISDRSIIYVNGIATPLKEAIEASRVVSNLHGQNVTLVYNAPHNPDQSENQLLTLAPMLQNITQESLTMEHRVVDKIIEQTIQKILNGDKEIIFVAHSQGTYFVAMAYFELMQAIEFIKTEADVSNFDNLRQSLNENGYFRNINLSDEVLKGMHSKISEGAFESGNPNNLVFRMKLFGDAVPNYLEEELVASIGEENLEINISEGDLNANLNNENYVEFARAAHSGAEEATSEICRYQDQPLSFDELTREERRIMAEQANQASESQAYVCHSTSNYFIRERPDRIIHSTDATVDPNYSGSFEVNA